MKRAITWLGENPILGTVLLFAAVLGGVLLFTGFDRPIYGDEGHFIATITMFSQDFSLHTLTSYNEMSTPLPFLLYALWGKLLGLDPVSLRILSLLVGLVTALLFASAVRLLLPNPRSRALAILVYLAQPYLIGFAIYIYTDLFAIAGLLLALIAAIKRQSFLLFLGLLIALLSRQYAVFFVGAALLYFLYELVLLQQGRAIRMLAAIVASIIPVIWLFFIWQGFSPANQMRELYLARPLSFSLTSLVLYLCCVTIYLFPALWVRRWQLLFSRSQVITACVVSLLYFFCPVLASEAAINVEIETVGLFHRLLRYCFTNRMIEHAIFYLCLLFGALAALHLLNDLVARWQKRQNGIEELLTLALLCFLLVMPFSYLRWEKYFTLLLPMLLIRLLMIPQVAGVSPQAQTRTPT